MATYVIGDVQGCFAALQRLLEAIAFDEDSDTLWFTGDLVNRGTQSLEVLRFIKALGDRHVAVLGNHDLHLLAVAYDAQRLRAADTLAAILTADDKDELIQWLTSLPLVHYANHYLLVHAGVPPIWNLDKTLMLAQEVQTVLRLTPEIFLQSMYGNLPDIWSDDLTGADRLRCITNYLTRMRFCDARGKLDLNCKGTLDRCPANLHPWFVLPNQLGKDCKIIFGHWAALGGITNVAQCYALDTGCVWGNSLTALRLEDEKRFNVCC